MILVSIDPSVNYTGYAVFKNTKLLKAGIIYGKDKVWKLKVYKKKGKSYINKAIGITNEINTLLRLENATRLLLEVPQSWKTPKGRFAAQSGAIMKLSFLVGMIHGMSLPICKSLLITPIEWKGNLSKEITTKRINKKYGLKLNWKTIDNNKADAIAMGDRYIRNLLKRKERKCSHK